MRKMSQFKFVLLWFGRIMLGIAAVTVVVGSGFAIETTIFILRSKHATASIVRLEEQTDNDGNVNYAPVFTFTASNSRQYTVRSIVATNPPGFEVGESADILYVPSKPSGARIASFWQMWFVSVLLGIIGVVNGFVGACFAYFARERKSVQAVPA